MINVIIFRSKKNITGFEVTGHARFGKHGEDIVCSAVSALTQTALLGLEKVAGVEVEYDIEEGYLLCRVKNIPSEIEGIKSFAILETMYEGLSNITLTYGKYMSLSDKEEV